MRTIDWRRSGTIVAVDQTRLPHELDVLEVLEVRSVDELVEAVQRLRLRGALALGVAAPGSASRRST